jgi:hypothetical protein
MMKLEEVAMLVKQYDVPALKKIGFDRVEYCSYGACVRADADAIVDSVDLSGETHYREHESDCYGTMYRFRGYMALGVDVLVVEPVEVPA